MERIFIGRSTSVCSPARTGQDAQGPPKGAQEGHKGAQETGGGGGGRPAANKRQRPSRRLFYSMALMHWNPPPPKKKLRKCQCYTG